MIHQRLVNSAEVIFREIMRWHTGAVAAGCISLVRSAPPPATHTQQLSARLTKGETSVTFLSLCVWGDNWAHIYQQPRTCVTQSAQVSGSVPDKRDLQRWIRWNSLSLGQQIRPLVNMKLVIQERVETGESTVAFTSALWAWSRMQKHHSNQAGRVCSSKHFIAFF